MGAGPVGLALAAQLARTQLSVIVLDRRPPPERDALRPQLLVARSGDLARLTALGIDTFDPSLVAVLASREQLGRFRPTDPIVLEPESGTDLWTTSSQPPLALVPIGRLQQALVALAVERGVEVQYDAQVTSLRRHATSSSLKLADGTSLSARLVIIATGHARALAFGAAASGPARHLVGAVFASGGEAARWVRVALRVRGLPLRARCTMLQTPDGMGAGTALLVDPQLESPSPAELHSAFEAAAAELGIAGELLSAPTPFSTSVSALPRRYVAGDNRAPVAVAGDAAQTGHVFSGQTCFANLALAQELGDQLGKVRDALADGAVNDRSIVDALARYDERSNIGAGILARVSQDHVRIDETWT